MPKKPDVLKLLTARRGQARRKYKTDKERIAAARASVIKWERVNRPLSRDIGDFPLSINWHRRLASKISLKTFCETYLTAIFFKSWSSDQLICLGKAEQVCREGGKFAIAMPRGGGKTAIVRAATLWATLYGYKRFVYNIGSKEILAFQTLEMIKDQLSNNPLLKQDFPELCWSISALEGSNRLARGQLYHGLPTHVNWEVDNLRYPTLILAEGTSKSQNGRGHTSPRKAHPAPPPGSVASYYWENDRDSIKYLEHLGAWIPSNAGVILRSSGIEGAIRGEAPSHPVTLEQPRPELVILDDIQKDQKADSPVLCEKLIRLIDGAITGLAGPGQHVDVLMPCTVIREGDVADTYLDPLKKPDWQGERCQLVKSWPPGITDYEITSDTAEGRHWAAYAELRRTSLRDKGTFEEATAYYRHYREVMDNGFVVSWPERYDPRTEISAQQHAMNLRLQLGPMFLPEYQNIGRQLITTSELLITAKQLAAKQVNIERGHMDPTYQFVVTHIDVQNEIFYWLTFACDTDYNGCFIDYGTWPETHHAYFTKSQAETWSLLTTEFFKAYPEHKNKAIRNSQGRIRAPFEAKIYFGLSRLVPMLLQKEYTRDDGCNRCFKAMRLGIDTRWGQASEVVKRYIRESGVQTIVPYYGQSIPPTHRQLEEYERREGWLFEQQLNPLVREPRWAIRPNPDGMFYMMADVNRLKDFLFQRLSVPPGAPGCISLFKAPVEQHELFANHICSSEYPEPVSARGITKNIWTLREGTAFDNDWLDCAAACMALASTLGVSLKTSDYQVKTIHRKLSEIRNLKRKG